MNWVAVFLLVPVASASSVASCVLLIFFAFAIGVAMDDRVSLSGLISVSVAQASQKDLMAASHPRIS
jgi:hypothetical protein